MSKDLTPQEIAALRHVEKTEDAEELRNMMKNAKGKSDAVEKAAFRKLVSISAKDKPGTVQHDCWQMVNTIEELRRLSGRTGGQVPMHRMRPKIEKDGEVAALAYCALHQTDGFDEVISYGMPELTAEAIALRHSALFEPKVLAAARQRLAAAGVVVGPDGRIEPTNAP